MREIIRTDYGEKELLVPKDIDDCMIDNFDAPIVRSGGEPFKSYYAVEWCYNCYSSIDPSRSFVNTLINVMDERCSAENNWPACDAIHILLMDLGFDYHCLTGADIVAFWTMFPNGTSEFLSLPYMRLHDFNNPHGEVVRVVNNPFFHKDTNASDRRLVEIAEINNFRFSLDRTSFIATPTVLARELSLLNFACSGDSGKVDSFTKKLSKIIEEIYDDWGLVPSEGASCARNVVEA